MNFSLALLLYISIGAALAGLRMSQGNALGDAIFSGLLWPMEWVCRLIEVAVSALIREFWHEEQA